MKIKLKTLEDLQDLQPQGLIFRYPLSGREEENYNENDYTQTNELIIAEINLPHYISFAENMQLSGDLSGMTVYASPRKNVADLLNGYWWKEIAD